MVTPIRKIEKGGIYHAINRGVEKREIFKKNQDYHRFVLGLYFFNDTKPSDIWQRVRYHDRNIILPDVDDRNNIVDLLAFALMPNHYHLIIRAKNEKDIPIFMNKLGGYTKYFNKQYNRVGPLFQGRYKLVPIKNEIQLINIFSYVHTNPVGLIEPKWKDLKVNNKLKAIEYLRKYKWSSYNDYIGDKIFPSVVQQEFFLNILGDKKQCFKVIEDWINFKAENADLDRKLLE